MIPEQFRISDCFSFGTVIFYMLPEHLSYPRHIRTAPTQESRRLKGTDTGFGKEIVGVDHDTRIQAVRFDIPDPDTIGKILQDLCNHLTG